MKISISLEEQQLRWFCRQAKTLGTTVSALMGEAVADLRRARECEQLLERLGGRVRISDREAVELRRSWDAD